MSSSSSLAIIARMSTPAMEPLTPRERAILGSLALRYRCGAELPAFGEKLLVAGRVFTVVRHDRQQDGTTIVRATPDVSPRLFVARCVAAAARAAFDLDNIDAPMFCVAEPEPMRTGGQVIATATLMFAGLLPVTPEN